MFYDVMVDIETTGVKPNTTNIIQIAGVKFNIKERAIDTNMFDRCLYPLDTRYWQESTRDFWTKTQANQKVLNEIYSRMEDPQTVLQAFVDWVTEGYDGKEPIRFWGKPTSFDYSFVQSYLDDFGIMNPFHFRMATDMNSYIRGMFQDPTMATFKVDEFHGDAHNAIMDSINQINQLFKATDHYEASR